MNWQLANRLAHIAATKAQARLGCDLGAYPVDVDLAIHNAGLALLFRPLPRLFGVYVESDGNRGVLLNSNMTRATRRHTAAHELGHHEFGHRPDPSRPCAFDAASSDNPATSRPIRMQGEREVVAEAFASWFLMPRRAVVAALSCMGTAGPTDASDIYQLSLMLGTSFNATCRHLVNLRLMSSASSQSASGIKPAALKRRLAGAAGLTLKTTVNVDIWDLRTRTASRLEVSEGDIVIVPTEAAKTFEGATGCTVLGGSQDATAVELNFSQHLHWGKGVIKVVAHSRPKGLYIPEYEQPMNSTDWEEETPA